ncbi:MAG TPA: protein phosphatase 2C domain-containing protein [Candidatus Sulfotelmatobacter sp.]|nr:protein phosphatase 2C domain-containing protein [Candidatus Sulfotelmatobacter sp.]
MNPSDAARSSATPADEADRRPPRVHADISALSHQGLVRRSNEDSYIVFRLGRYLERVTSNIPESELPSRFDDTGHLMVVADGMGGHQAGEVASRGALVKTLQLILRSPRWALNLDDPTTREKEIQDLLSRSRGYLAAVHASLRAEADSDAQLEGMGTTLTGAYTVGADLFVLHVGDSKAYLVRGGQLKKITHDHTVAQQYADLGVIPQEAVPAHRMSHMLTRAIGAPMELSGDLHHLRLEHGDRLLLCSDGLTDMAGEQEILGVLGARPDSVTACQGLVDLALASGGRDNVTVIVAQFAVE